MQHSQESPSRARQAAVLGLLLAEGFAEVKNRLPSPPSPVVAYIVAPNISVVRDALGFENVGEPVGLFDTALFPSPLASDQCQVGVGPYLFQAFAFEIADVGHRVVEVDIAV